MFQVLDSFAQVVGIGLSPAALQKAHCPSAEQTW